MTCNNGAVVTQTGSLFTVTLRALDGIAYLKNFVSTGCCGNESILFELTLEESDALKLPIAGAVTSARILNSWAIRENDGAPISVTDIWEAA